MILIENKLKLFKSLLVVKDSVFYKKNLLDLDVIIPSFHLIFHLPFIRENLQKGLNLFLFLRLKKLHISNFVIDIRLFYIYFV